MDLRTLRVQTFLLESWSIPLTVEEFGSLISQPHDPNTTATLKIEKLFRFLTKLSLAVLSKYVPLRLDNELRANVTEMGKRPSFNLQLALTMI